jgi:outer membrane protein
MKRIFTVLFIALGLLTATSAQSQQKIGYISTQDLISVMPETKVADSNLTQLQNALIQNAQEKEAKLNSDIEKFNKDSGTMSEAVKSVKRQELQKLYQELAGEEQRIQQQLTQRRDQLLAPIQRKAFETVQNVAKENGYTLIFEKEALLVAPPGDDILPLVAKKLNIKLNVTTPGTTPPTTNPPATNPQKKGN